jgi:sigma-E factor negative regulatory protein RseA
MSDTERDSQLSAMFDGELPAAECELVARRLARDPRLKRQWSRYSLIGAVIRGEPLQTAGHAPAREESRLARRVAEAIATDATAAASVAAPTPPAVAPVPPRWQRPLAGLGIAAAVAGLAVLGLQFRGTSVSEPPSLSVRAVVEDEVIIPMLPVGDIGLPASGGSEPESYTVPIAGESRGGAAAPSPQLANFVVAHSEYSAPLARRNLLASILASEAPEGTTPAAGGSPGSIPASGEVDAR